MRAARIAGRTEYPGLSAAAMAVLVALAVVWCSQAVRKAERRSGNDLTGYLEASRALYAGTDPYHLPERFPYIYPLFLAAIIRPLAALPVPVASVVWFALQAACLCYVVRTTGRRVRDHIVIAAAVVLVFGDVLQNEFLNGQVNLLVLALVVAAVHLTRRRPRVAAALLGAAIAVKLTPALLWLYWLIERRYRHVLESTAWAAVFIASPWLVVRDRLWPLYESYTREFILARASSADPHAGAIFFTPYGFWGWLTGTAPGRLAIVAAVVAVLGLLVVWHSRVRGGSSNRADPVAWIYAAAAPMLSPMSEVHHLTSLVPSAMSTAGAVRERHDTSRLVLGSSAMFVVLIWIGYFDRTGPWYFFSILCLLCAALVHVREATGRSDGDD